MNNVSFGRYFQYKDSLYFFRKHKRSYTLYRYCLEGGELEKVTGFTKEYILSEAYHKATSLNIIFIQKIA